MKKIFITIPIVAATLLFSACRKGFEAINTDPNSSTTINPQYLLSTALVNTAYPYQKDAYMDKPAEAGRYITKVRNENDDLFGWSAGSWDGFYQVLSVNNEMYELAKASKMYQYMGVSRIIRVFNFSVITDLHGDCPYSEALQSKDENIVHPKYDAQQDIYADMLKTLASANDSLASVSQPLDVAYDIMYHGSILKWRKFANALQLRLLLRISGKDKTAFTQIQQIVSNPDRYPLFESNDDEAAVPYKGITATNSWTGGNLVNSVAETQKYKPSKEIVDALLSLNDPRLLVWVAPVDSLKGYTTDPHPYVGVPNAISSPYDYNGGETHISELSNMYYQNGHPMLKASLMTYAEQCFILAEAVQQGGVTMNGETAESLYKKGIQASMTSYGISAADQDTYLKQASVVYNGTHVQLMTQKWIAGFLKGFEGWFDNRRTGLPAFTPGPLSALRTIPMRYLYPTLEQTLNADAYNAVLKVQGEDKTTTLMWYLKK